MRWALLILVWAQTDPLETELSEIVRRFNSPDATHRDAASKDLEAFCRKAGDKATDYLKKHAASSDPEAKARVQSQLSLLSRVQETRKLLAVFDVVELPNCTGKKLAIYNPGWLGSHNGEPRYQYLLGWVVSETDDKITLTDTQLTTQVHARDRRLPPEWDQIKARLPRDLPLPGEFRSIEWRDFFKEFSYREGTNYAAHKDVDLAVDGLGLALCAYRAFQEGEDRIGFDLLEASKKGVMDWQEPAKPYPDLLRKVLAGQLRDLAITSANRGRPRPELVKNWKTVDQLAPQLNGGEAGEMVKLYEALIAEDAAWKDPTPGELAAMPPAKRVAVWIHRLRDHDAFQMSNPGSCSVFGPSHQGRLAEERKTVYLNPADELVKLGWNAIPLLIDGLEDRHPTRCEGGSMGPDHLLRIGDCCQQIFEAISGIPIWEEKNRDQIMTRDGAVSEAKAKAAKWWEEHGKGGAETYYLRRLESTEFVGHSAKQLLNLDAAKYAPALLEMLRKGDPERRRILLPMLRPYVTKAHQGILESFLGDESLYALLEASEALWTVCGSEAGALELSRRLQTREYSRNDLWFLENRIFDLFRAAGSDRIVDGLCALTKSPRESIRVNAMGSLACFPSPKSAAVLVDQLDDRAKTGFTSDYPRRFCDDGAAALLKMLGLDAKFRLESDTDKRNQSIDELKTWWTRNRESVDWTSLQAHAREARQPQK